MENKKLWIIAALLCLTSFLVYIPAVENDFVNWDDNVYVYKNKELTSHGADFIQWAFSTTRTGNWIPVTWLSLRLDYTFWGLDPFGYHLTNIILHSFNTFIMIILTALLFSRVYNSLNSRSILAAALAGIIFGLHPLHVESVAWISERKDVLYSFFWLLSIIAYIMYTSAAMSRRKRQYYSICILLFALSLLSKPMAVTLPIVLLILDYYPLKRFHHEKGFVKVVFMEKLPFYMLSLIFSIAAFIAQGKSSAMEAMHYLSLSERIWSALKALCFYLVKTVWPVNLVPFYPLKTDISLMTPEYLVSLIIVICITAVCVGTRNRIPVLTMSWTYYVISLLPVLGIIQVGAQEAADRYMYMPMAGPIMVIAALSSRVWDRGKQSRYTLVALTLFAAVVLSFLTVKQIFAWKDSITLWEYVTAREPGAAKAQYNLGNAYRDKGDLIKAEKAWRRTLEVEPAHSPALNQLGNIYLLSGLVAEAKKYYSAAVRSDGKNAEARYNLALTLEKLNDTEGALKHYIVFIETASSEYDHMIPEVRRKVSLLKSVSNNS